MSLSGTQGVQALDRGRVAGPTAPIRVITALSTREAEILEWASEGRAIKEIARLLGLGPNGVKFHLKNIHTKLGARRRTEAVRIARDHGLIQPIPREEECMTIVVPTRRSPQKSAQVYVGTQGLGAISLAGSDVVSLRPTDVTALIIEDRDPERSGANLRRPN